MPEMSGSGDEYVTIEEIAERIGKSESSAWTLVRRTAIPRYRLPNRGKVTYFLWADVEAAMSQPIPIGEPKKATPLAA